VPFPSEEITAKISHQEKGNAIKTTLGAIKLLITLQCLNGEKTNWT